MVNTVLILIGLRSCITVPDKKKRKVFHVKDLLYLWVKIAASEPMVTWFPK
jgi:hypothetical protein